MTAPVRNNEVSGVTGRVKDLILGMGLGLIIAGVFSSLLPPSGIDRNTVIQRAKALGMVFPQETSAGMALNSETEVEITPGLTAAQIAARLEEAGVLTNRRELITLAGERGTETRFASGTYYFSGIESAEEIMQRLTTGQFRK